MYFYIINLKYGLLLVGIKPMLLFLVLRVKIIKK